MPLSEEELRLLEQMERALVEEDPKFASTLRGTTLRQSARRKAILAGVVFVGGIVVLMTGAIQALPVVGVLGFLIMLVSATVGLTVLRGQRAAPAGDAPHAQGGGAPPPAGASPSSTAAGPASSAVSATRPAVRSWTAWRSAGAAAARTTGSEPEAAQVPGSAGHELDQAASRPAVRTGVLSARLRLSPRGRRRRCRSSPRRTRSRRAVGVAGSRTANAAATRHAGASPAARRPGARR